MADITAVLIMLMSFFPLYTGPTIAFDDALVGTWGVENNQAAWELTELEGGDGYHLVYTDPMGIEGEFTAYLVDLDGKLFLDLYPDTYGMADMNLLYSSGFFPTHTFMYVEKTGTSLTLWGFDGGWVYDYLRQNPDACAYNVSDEGMMLLTGPPEELQDFLLDIVENEGGFMGSETFSRM